MKTSYLTLVLLNVSYNCFCQQTVTGTITNQADKPVSFATITNSKKSHGVNSDANGFFSFVSSEKIDTLTINALGYKTLTFVTNEEYSKLVLKEDTVQLETIKVKRSIPKINIYGNNNKKQIGVFKNCSKTNLELSFRLHKSEYADCYLQKLVLYITKDVRYNAPFRVRLYTDKGGFPARSLLNSNIVFSAFRPNSWTVLDLTSYNIKIPDDQDYHVSIEWLYSDDSTKQLEFSDGSCYGMALGMNKFGKEVLSCLRTNGGEWSRCNYYKFPDGTIYNPMIQVVLESFN